MADNNSNLLADLEQIREREQANLASIDAMRDEAVLSDIRLIRLKSMEILEALDQIAATVKAGGGEDRKEGGRR